MAARQYYYTSDASRVSTTSATMVTRSSFSFTPDANSTYYIFASCVADADPGLTSLRVRFYDVTNATAWGDCNGGVETTSDRRRFTWLARHVAGGTPVQQTWRIEYMSWTAGQPAYLSDVFIIAIKAAAADQWAQDLTLTSTTSSTPQNKVTLTFTPATQGDYVIIAGMEAFGGDAVHKTGFDLFDGTTRYSRLDSGYGLQHRFLGFTGPATLSASSKTFNLRFWSVDAVTTVESRFACILALRLDGFDNAIGGRNGSTATTTSTSPQTHSSATGTVYSVAHLNLGNMITGQSGTGATDFSRDGTAIQEARKNDNAELTRSWASDFISIDSPAAGGSATLALRHWVTSTGTSEVNESAFATIQLDAVPPGTVSRLAPDAILASSNLGASPSVSTIQDDPDSPDANWLTAASHSTATDIRVSFPSPQADLVTGNHQQFKMWLRKSTTSSANPTVDVQLYEGGSSKGTLATGTAISSTTGQLVSAAWDASLLTAVSGANVEVRAVSTPAGGAATAAPGYEQTGTPTKSTASPLSVAYPAGIVAGNLLILQVVGRAAAAPTVSEPGGWGTLYNETGSTVCRQALFHRVADGTETGNLSVTVSGTTASYIAWIHEFSGVDVSGTIPESGDTATGSSNSISVPAVTTAGAYRLCLVFFMAADNNTASPAAANYTEPVADTNYTSNTGSMAGVQSYTATNQGTVGATTIGMSASDPWLSRSFALKPAVPPSVSVDIGAIEWNARHESAPAERMLPIMLRHAPNPHFMGMV